MTVKKGFTLIELLIVIVILGVLAALISGNFITSLKKGRDAKRKTDLEQIQRALEMRYEDKKNYPMFLLPAGNRLCETDTVTPPTVCTGKTYMQKIPGDPIGGGDYGYEYDTTNGTYYKLYTCLENNMQILPYESNPTTFSCAHQCEYPADNPVNCIWGISSPNTTP